MTVGASVHIQIICGALKLFAKDHCDSREASARSNYLRHAQIICKALTLFEAALLSMCPTGLPAFSVLCSVSAPRSAAPLCRYLCRNEISRSPLSCPWLRFGGVMQREARCFCPPHMTRKMQKERAAPHTFRSRNAETQKLGRRSNWYGRCQGGSAATACPVEIATVTVVLRHGVGWSSWEQHGLSWARKLNKPAARRRGRVRSSTASGPGLLRGT